jgi:hypothetical protein
MVFQIATFESSDAGICGVVSFSEAGSVGAEDNVAFAGQSDTGDVHCAEVGGAHTGRFIFADIVLACVLMPEADSGCGRLWRDTIGNQQPCGNAFVGFSEVVNAFEAVSVFLQGTFHFGL